MNIIFYETKFGHLSWLLFCLYRNVEVWIIIFNPRFTGSQNKRDAHDSTVLNRNIQCLKSSGEWVPTVKGETNLMCIWIKRVLVNCNLKRWVSSKTILKYCLTGTFKCCRVGRNYRGWRALLQETLTTWLSIYPFFDGNHIDFQILPATLP